MNRPKILTTLGPVSLNSEIIKKLSDRGVDYFRINMSHTSIDELKQHIEGVMGMRLTDTQHKLLEESFNETYYKELSAFNAEERAELTLGMSRSRELRDTYEATY